MTGEGDPRRTVFDELAARVRMERALAEASQALLSYPTSDGLELAIRVLAEATGADYGYIERIDDPNAESGWAEVVALGFPTGSDMDRSSVWMGGALEQYPLWVDRLTAGDVLEVRTEDLVGEERLLQEKYGIVSELVVGVYRRGVWIGGIGIVSLDDRAWPPYSAEAMSRVADMVSSFWEREDMTRELTDLVASKDEFLASISHELRTPLTAVLGLSEILADPDSDLSDDDRARFLGDIVSQSRDMSNLIEDLLTFARADMGGLHLDPTEIDLGAEIDLVVGRFAHDSGIPIRHVERTGSARCWADPVRVRQILRNLISNAFRYGGPIIEVTISTVPGGRSELVVADDGPEIAGDLLEEIFEPYRRLHGSYTQPGSVGLGLSVSRKLARLMGGDLTVERIDDQTRFVLVLPSRGG